MLALQGQGTTCICPAWLTGQVGVRYIKTLFMCVEGGEIPKIHFRFQIIILYQYKLNYKVIKYAFSFKKLCWIVHSNFKNNTLKLLLKIIKQN